VSLFSCLDQPLPNAKQLIPVDGLFETVAAVFLAAVVVVIFISPLIRMAYRKRVVRLMGLNQVQSRPGGWWRAHSIEPNRARATKPDLVEQADNANAWESRILRASIAGWLGFVLFAPVILILIGANANLIDMLDYAVGAGLLAMGAVLVNLPVRWKRKGLVSAIILALLMILPLEAAEILGIGQPAVGVGDGLPDLGDLMILLAVVPLYLALFNRRLRGLVIPSSIVISVGILAFILPIVLVQDHLGSCVTSLSSTSDEPWGLAVSFAGASLIVFGMWLGFRAVGALASLVERGFLSDLSLASMFGLTIMAIVMVFGTDSKNVSSTLAFASIFLWVAVPALIYRIVLGKRSLTEPGPALLVLRVFSRDKKQQNLLEAVQSRWRYIGAVHQAGGPDMVDLNIDPYECAMFLSSNLHSLYLPEAVSAEQLRGRLIEKPDREGRYRINEMFNFNTAWRNNIEQLILLSKTILLDLRGLTADREGTSFEIGLLARHGLLSRVVAIGDDLTDWDHVGLQLQTAGSSLEQLTRVNVTKQDGVDDLYSRLLKVSATKDRNEGQDG